MNLWEILKTSKGLPPPDLETLLFARKIGGQAVGGSTLKTITASGYPCALENSAGMPILDYKIYGNSVQDGTPTPENPIEVQSVGDKTKNLFNENDVTYNYWINADGSIHRRVFALKYNRNIAVVTGRTIGAKAYGGMPYNIGISYYDTDNNFISRTNSTSGSFVSTSPSNAAYGVFCVAASSSDDIPITPEKLASYKIMLTYGDSTAYEPYGYKIPVVVTGKNLFDVANTQWTNNTYLSETGELVANVSWKTSDYIPVRGMVFTINNQIGNSPCICLYDANKNLIAAQKYGGKKVTTITSNEMAHYCRFSLYISSNGISPNRVQLELGTESTAYEPYHAETTNIYLDEPLRKIGDYADVIDFNRGVVERKICKLIFTGDENIKSGHLSVNLFEFNMTGYLRELTVTSLSSHYQAQENVTGYSVVRDMCCSFYANPIALHFSLLYIRDSRFRTIADFKSYLTQQYDAGTPVTVYYALAEPTTEPISLPSITTFDGTTVISTDTQIQPSNIEIKYKARK